ncbi:MAG: S8 family serine peptidase [Acholeplasmataceae bacterium]|nr:S8 family serine peptidase [Acholeplasmataceae bacterium]
MRHRGYLKTAILTILILFHFCSLFFLPSMQNQDPFYTQELVYRFEDTYQMDSLLIENDLTLIELKPSGVARLQIGKKTDVTHLLENGFAYNQLSTVSRPPWQSTQDPYLSNQYALTMMETIEAWDLNVGSSDVTVAIIDTGIDINHDEFNNRISLNSYNSSTETVGLTAVQDDYGHGTMVAGVIGAIKDNSKGIAGIAQNVQLLVIKANKPEEGSFLDSALIDGIYYAVSQGADIINLSLGGSYKNTQTETAIDYAHQQGVIVVAAAGNDGTSDLVYPAAFEKTLAISSIDASQTIAPYSNFGNHIDLTAPGSDIITTARNNGYATVSGTSFAAPQVSGVIALMLSHFDNFSIAEMTARLFDTTVDLGSPGKDVFYGHGLVNTLNVLSAEFVTISFETFDADPVDSMYVQKGEFVFLPQPTKIDHVFDGWYLDPSFVEPWIDGTTVPQNDLTLYAKFNAEFHNVHFVTSGTPVSSLVVAHGDTFDLPISEKSGYHFLGWTEDSECQTPYEMSPVMYDVTLYAHFEAIVYHQITLWDGDEIIDVITIESGLTLELEDIEKTGYTFDGWYLDALWTLAYTSMMVESDLDIFVKLSINSYRVVFMTHGGESIDDIWVTYLNTFELPTPFKDELIFIDWFIDDGFSLAYVLEPVTQDITLHAYFAEEAFLVSYHVDGLIYLEKYVEAFTTFVPITPVKAGFEFVGWFIDDLLLTPYASEPISHHLILHAAFDEQIYSVTFYDSDLTTVIEQVFATFGQSVIAPEGPTKTSSTSFIYTFITWSENTNQVTSDMNIYPLYGRVFKYESVMLNPGIDTVTQHESWVDFGIVLLDASLSYDVQSNINVAVPGRYKVEYRIYDGSELVHTKIRMVRVIDFTPMIDLTLNDGIDTIFVGEDHVDAGLKYQQTYLVTIVSDVNTSEAGTYTIVYMVEVNGMTYQKTRYVTVITTEEIETQRTDAIILKRKGDAYEI